MSMLQNQIIQLSILLQNETELHQITRSLLDQSRSSGRTWERAYSNLLAEMEFTLLQLSGAEARVNQLTNENSRLNQTINQVSTLPP